MKQAKLSTYNDINHIIDITYYRSLCRYQCQHQIGLVLMFVALTTGIVNRT